jgi:hypothetical protein
LICHAGAHAFLCRLTNVHTVRRWSRQQHILITGYAVDVAPLTGVNFERDDFPAVLFFIFFSSDREPVLLIRRRTLRSLRCPHRLQDVRDPRKEIVILAKHLVETLRNLIAMGGHEINYCSLMPNRRRLHASIMSFSRISKPIVQSCALVLHRCCMPSNHTLDRRNKGVVVDSFFKRLA